MKVRMKGDVSGSRNGVPWPPRGGTVDLPDDEAADLCRIGLAEPVSEDEAKVEKAVPDESDVANRGDGLTKATAGSVTPGNSEDNAEPKGEKAPAPAKKAAAKRAPAKPSQGEDK